MHATIRAIGLLVAIAGAQAAQQSRMTPAWRTAVVEGVSAQLLEAYFDKAVAGKIAAHVRSRLKAGAYDSLDDPAEFARLLTTHLREVNGDLHLNVRYSAEPIPERRTPSEPTAEEVANQRYRAATVNFGFTEFRVLRANVRYIRFDAFHPLRWSEPALSAALAFARDGTALILDLRYNTGGEADMVDRFNDELLRRDPALTLILTSGGTASAAEAVAYRMRERNGATLIGEKTLGAGNAGTNRRVDAHFEVFVPVVHTEWDGVGVAPHVEVAPEAALERAQQLAAERLARLRAELILSDIREAPLDAAEAKTIVGRYQYPASVLRLWIEADRLIAQVEGRARRYSFTRRMDGSYFAAADRVVIRFLRNDAGGVLGLDWTEGGRSSPARRIP
jgi:hypothetical protein